MTPRISQGLVWLLSISLLGNLGCPTDQTSTCTRDEDCASADPCVAEVCVGGICANPPIQDCCVTDDNCAEGESCVNGACIPECTEAQQCDDENVCTSDECENNRCVHEPIGDCCDFDDDCDIYANESCIDHVCTPECESDADCEDQNPCTTHACVSGGCSIETIDGCCVTESDCDAAAGESCVNNACVQLCVADDDCLDTDPCTTNTCPNGVCVTDEIEGCCTGPEDCGENQTCLNLACTASCDVDADCDDGDFCTGQETCVDGGCVPGEYPCDPEYQYCADNSCIGEPPVSVLTEEIDFIIGSSSDDIIYGSSITLGSQDNINLQGGTDTLAVTLVDPVVISPTLISVEIIEIAVYGECIFDVVNSDSTATIRLDGGDDTLTLLSLSPSTEVALLADFEGQVSLKLLSDTGAEDSMTVELDGPLGGARVSYQGEGQLLETLVLEVASDTVLAPAEPGVSYFGDVGTVVLTGSAHLTLDGALETDTGPLDTSNFEGQLTFQ